MRSIVLTSIMSVLIALAGCEQKSAAPAPGKPADGGTAAGKPSGGGPTAAKKDDHDHKEGEKHAEGDGHDHEKEGDDDHKHIELGSVTIAGFPVRAVLGGEVVAGKEVDVDVHVTGSEGKVTAVRLWIGTEDGKSAVKMKATINKDEAHNHVEAPSPLPAGAKLCIELELTSGKKKVGSLALKK